MLNEREPEDSPREAPKCEPSASARHKGGRQIERSLAAARKSLHALGAFAAREAEAEPQVVGAMIAAACERLRDYQWDVERAFARNPERAGKASRLLRDHVLHALSTHMVQLSRLLAESKRRGTSRQLARRACSIAIATDVSLEQLARDADWATGEPRLASDE